MEVFNTMKANLIIVQKENHPSAILNSTSYLKDLNESKLLLR